MKRFMTICLISFCLGLVSPVLYATLSIEASGFSTKGTPVSFKAEFTISGDDLTIELTNTSPSASAYQADVLGSFYFDIMNGDGRPTLTLTEATGDIWLVKSGEDDDELIGEDADLMTMVDPMALDNDMGWIFKSMNAAYSPYLGFGIGTVGNSTLTPNNFPAMNGIETAIYTGEVIGSSLGGPEGDGRVLVKDSASFTFSGVYGYSEEHISSDVAFGLGTAPDSFIPEPATLVLLGLGGLVLLKRK